MFITFEGIDGCGKSTQVQKLYEWMGESVIKTREPYVLRDTINGIKDRGGRAMIMTFMADRAIHYEEVIRPALGMGVTVLCDRWIDSTRVYQDRFEWHEVERISDFSCCYTEPDLTFLIDLDPVDAMVRLEARGGLDRFDKDNLEIHRKRRMAYWKLAEENERIVVIQGHGTEDEVFERILKHV